MKTRNTSYVRYVILIRCILFVLIFVTSQTKPAAQSFKVKEIGTPYLRIYPVEETGGHSQNWDITEGDDGTMYFANNNGVLRFDGSYWDMVYRSDGYTTRSVCNCFGKIYTGGTSDLGVLEPDSVGSLRFRSMLEKAPDKIKEAKSMWDAQCADDGVYWRSYDYVFRYNPAEDSMYIYPASTRYYGVSIAGGKAYAWDSGRGLIRFSDNSEEIIIKSSDTDFTGYEVTPFRGDTLLLNTNNGFYKLIGKTLIKWKTAVRDQVSARIYKIKDLRGNYTAMATLGEGTFIMDREGQLTQQINQNNGLLTDRTYQVFVDSRTNLWIANNNGLVQVEINSPFTTFGKESGLDGSMIHIESTDNELYVGGYEGLFRKPHNRPWQRLGSTAFSEVPGFDDQGWVFVEKGDDILLLSGNKISLLNGSRFKPIFQGNHIWAVVNGSDPNELITGSTDGKFYFAEKVNGKWRHRWQIKGISQFMDFMEQEEDGSIWLTDSGTGVFRFRLNEKKDSVEWMTTYGKAQGLPDSLGNRVYRHSTGLKFITKKGVYNYDIEQDKFFPDPAFEEAIGEDYLFRFVEVPNGDIFLSSDNIGKGYLRKKEDGSYDVISRPFEKVQDLNTEFVRAFDAKNVMVANRTGVLHYDPSYEKDYDVPFNTTVRSVVITSKDDSLIHGGVDMGLIPELDYVYNALKFQYSAIYYDESEQLEFRSYLDGFERTWGKWTSSGEKEYTNLPHGTYTFTVEARNIYGVTGQTATYTFEILPPWYFTVWAYTGYAALFAGFIWLVVRINSKRLIAENIKLEGIIQERTLEIREQAEKLKELDRVKTRFFSNISHEFRTPLTLIKGPIEAILSGKVQDKKAEKRNLEVAQRNSVMLQNLIDEILEFNRLETGSIVVNRQPVFLDDFLNELSNNYSLLAEENGLKWSLEMQVEKDLKVGLDANKFEHILNNLVSNAVKHTRKNGKVQLRISYENEVIHGSVKDSGVGIEADELEHIFERFYQTFHGSQSMHSSGIGLAYVREIIEQMDGSIHVESTVGVGTTFRFTIPAGKLDMESVVVRAEEKEDLELPDRYPHENNKILIVEDNTEMQDYIRQILSEEFNLETVGNGKEALEKVEAFNPDLIISDIMMPVMDGMELLRNLKGDEKLRYKSVIMLTAKSGQETKLEALQFGLDDYITKPFNPLELEIRVKNILGNQFERMQVILGETDNESAEESSDPLIEELKSKIEENISDSRFGVLNLSDHASLSDRQLTRIVKKATGLTPANLIREVKLQKGKTYFEQKSYRTVAEVSYAVGFEKPSYFSKIYFERFGKKPSEYLL